MSSQLNITLSDNLRPFIQYFEKRNIEWKEVAQRFFPLFEKGEPFWLPSVQVMRFLAEMGRITDSDLGYEVGKNLSISEIAPIIESQTSDCRDLETCMHKLVDIMFDLNNHVIVWTEKIDGTWYLCHRGTYSKNTLGHDHTEWFRSFALISLCRKFLGDNWEPQRVFMSSPYHLTHHLATDKYTFDHQFGAIQVPLKNEFKPFDGEVPDLEWITEMVRLANTYALLPSFTAEWFSRLVGVSKRTLHRRLSENDISFKQIKNEARNKTAKLLLSESPLMPDDVAWHCGFNDLSNFNRAFKVWNNCTPSQYKSKTYRLIG